MAVEIQLPHISRPRKGQRGLSASNQCPISQVSYGTRCLLNRRPQCPIRAENLQAKKQVSPVDNIPQGVRDFLGPDNLHLFKRDDFAAVLPEGRPHRRADPDKDNS